MFVVTRVVIVFVFRVFYMNQLRIYKYMYVVVKSNSDLCPKRKKEIEK